MTMMTMNPASRLKLFRLFLQLLLGSLVLCCAGLAWAASYTLPGSVTGTPFSSCSLSGTTYTCTGSITINNNDTVTFTSSLTFNIAGSFNLGSGASLLKAAGATVTIVTTGSINLGNNSTSNANFQSDQSITTGTNAVVNGDLSASQTINLGNNSVTNGNVSGNTINFGNGSTSVTGVCSPSHPQCAGNAVLAAYRFDESSWAGAAGSVLDSSGNGYHATAYAGATTDGGSPAYVSGSQSTCRYGYFDRSGVTLSYVQLPASLPKLTGSFSVAAWIRSPSPNAQQQRIFVNDDNDNGWGLSLADGTQGGIRLFNRNVNFTSTSGAGAGSGGVILQTPNNVVAANTWYFVVATVNTGTKQARLYVYDTSGTQRALTTGTYTGTWCASGTCTGATAIGGETSASSEGQQTGFHFLGHIDEPRIYRSALSQVMIQSLLTTVRTCPVSAPHHLEILHGSGSGLTCAASTLTIRACQDAACSVAYTGGVSGTLSATGTPTANWDGGAGFTIPTGSNSVTKNVQVTPAGTVLLDTSGVSPVPTNATTCNFGSPACTFTAETAGFIFSNTTTGGSYTIPAQVSGIASGQLYLRALQASTTNPAVCTPAIISQTTDVNLGYGCNDPATCQAGNLVTINNTTAVPSTGVPVSLVFDANASAPVTVRYDDAGRITLNASKSITPTGGTAVTLTGSSNAFVVAPHHFGFSAVTAGPIKAGTNFSATVTAYNGLTTPGATRNFGQEMTPESVNLSFTKFQPTGTGAVNGNLTGTVGSFSAGVATSSNLNWSEVGLIDLTATLSSGSYLGSGLTATGSTGSSGAVGRFIPHHFDVTVTEGCSPGSYTYSGQPFNAKVTAMNGLASPTKTQNYDGTVNTSPNFAKAVTLSEVNGVAGTLSPVNVAVTAFAAGEASPTPAFAFTVLPTVPGTIKLRAVDADSVTSQGAAEGTAVIRSGRVQLFNAYGSEQLDLPMTLRAEYWTALGWTRNTDDTCTGNTTLGAANAVSIAFSSPNPAGLTTCVLDSGSPGLSGAGCSVAGAAARQFRSGTTLSQGDFNLWLRRTGLTGYVTVTANVPTWLEFNWTGGTADPVARATFGAYRSPLIYRRENY